MNGELRMVNGEKWSYFPFKLNGVPRMNGGSTNAGSYLNVITGTQAGIMTQNPHHAALGAAAVVDSSAGRLLPHRPQGWEQKVRRPSGSGRGGHGTSSASMGRGKYGRRPTKGSLILVWIEAAMRLPPPRACEGHPPEPAVVAQGAQDVHPRAGAVEAVAHCVAEVGTVLRSAALEEGRGEGP